LAIVVSFREKSFVLKQPSPRATMAALYVRLPGSYTTSRGTIRAFTFVTASSCTHLEGNP